MTKLKDFYGISYAENASRGLRANYKFPEQDRVFITFKNLSELREVALGISPLLMAARQKRAKGKARKLPNLEEALIDYRNRMVSGSDKPITREHKTQAVSSLRRMLNFCGWKKFTDLSRADLLKYQIKRIDHASSNHKDLGALKTFLRRHDDLGVHFPDWLRNFIFKKPEPNKTHSAWTEEVYANWWKYLTKDMEILAQADPDWSWDERIQRCCPDREFQQRMMLLVVQLLQGRALHRPGESRRTLVGDWNGQSRILTLSRRAAKALIKHTLTDDESAWLYNLASQKRKNDDNLASFYGKKWSKGYLYAVTRYHLDRAGMLDKKPYDVKYTLASLIYNRPELFADADHERRIARVRAVLGHGRDSKSTERYIVDNFGSEFGVPVQSFFNTQKLFPFDISKYPVADSVPGSRAESKRIVG